MKAMKRMSTKKQKEKTSTATAPSELSSFSLAAAISEATSSASAQSSQSQQSQSRKIFSIASPGRLGRSKSTTTTSQQSIATNTSFATAIDVESEQPINEAIITPASYFVDSSDDDDETNEGLTFGNDPLAVLSHTSTSSSGTPTEITFSSNPEETTNMAKKNKSIRIAPAAVVAAPIAAKVATPAPPASAPVVVSKEPETITKEPETTTATVVKQTTATDEEDAHFDVAQNVYGTAKNVWAWGKTIPVVQNFLGLTESVTAKVLDTAIHMDLPAIDQKAVTPQLKKLDDELVTPVILAIWKIVEPAVVKGEEMIVKPVLTEVVPRVMAPLGMFMFEDQKKKEQKQIQKEEIIDASATPEVVPALN